MLARGALGNPWLFRELVDGRERGAPSTREVLAELEWVIDRAVEHLGRERATRYLRKFYPWYVARLELDRHAAGALQAALQETSELERVRDLSRRACECECAPLAA
jgi:tRNA-dihydrouridine synthase